MVWKYEVNFMCVAYPGTVIALKEEGREAVVDFAGTVLNARTGFLPVREGDHVLVHAGCVLQVLPEDEAKALESIFNDIAEIEGHSKPYAAEAAEEAGNGKENAGR